MKVEKSKATKSVGKKITNAMSAGVKKIQVMRTSAALKAWATRKKQGWVHPSKRKANAKTKKPPVRAAVAA